MTSARSVSRLVSALILCRRPGGSQSGSGRFGEDTNFLPPSGIEPRFFGCPPRSLVTVLTELPRICLLSPKTITGRNLGQVSRSPCRVLNRCLSICKSRLLLVVVNLLCGCLELRRLRYVGHCFMWQLSFGLLQRGEGRASGYRVKY